MVRGYRLSVGSISGTERRSETKHFGHALNQDHAPSGASSKLPVAQSMTTSSTQSRGSARANWGPARRTWESVNAASSQSSHWA